MTGWLRRWRSPSAPAEMSFLDHLEELRGVLIGSIAVWLLLAIGAWFFSARILDFLVARTVGTAQFIRPIEAFTTRVKLSLLLAFIAGLPYIAYRVWEFIVPGLLGHERRVVLPLVFWSNMLFLTGVGFAVFLLTPTMLRVMLSFSTELIKANIAVAPLLDFFVKMSFACGLMFQLPLVIAVLSHFEIVTPRFLTSKWRHAVIVILIVAAVVTPGDGPSQLVLAVPVILLYFLSIMISRAIWRGKSKRDGDSGGHAPPSPPPRALPPAKEPPVPPPTEPEARPLGPPGDCSCPRDTVPKPLHPPDQDFSI